MSYCALGYKKAKYDWKGCYGALRVLAYSIICNSLLDKPKDNMLEYFA